MAESEELLDHTRMRESLGCRRQVKPPVHEPPPLEYYFQNLFKIVFI